MRAIDRAGVLADVSRILADQNISIGAMIQKEAPEGEEATDIIMLTHKTLEKNTSAAIEKIEALPTIQGKIIKLRMEELN
jgi:homoserine dehydrogenase